MSLTPLKSNLFWELRSQKAADLRVGRITLSAVTIRYVSLLVFT